MTEEERLERIELRDTILAKLALLGEGKDREWALEGMFYMAGHLCLHWDIEVLKFWVWHLDWMLDREYD